MQCRCSQTDPRPGTRPGGKCVFPQFVQSDFGWSAAALLKMGSACRCENAWEQTVKNAKKTCQDQCQCIARMTAVYCTHDRCYFQAMSSTETEQSVKPFSVKSRNAVRKSKPQPKRYAARTPGVGRKTSDDFSSEFARKMSDATKYHRGCPHCKFDCFKKMQCCLAGIVEWRKAVKDLPPTAEKELLWIFRASRPLAKPPQPMKRKRADVDDSGQDGATTGTEESGPRTNNLARKKMKRAVSDSGTETSHSEADGSDCESGDLQLAGHAFPTGARTARLRPNQKQEEKRVSCLQK